MQLHTSKIVLSLAYLLLAIITIVSVRDYAERDLRGKAQLEMHRLESKLDIALDKYRSIPKILAANERLIQLIKQQDAKTISEANQLLEQYNEELGSDAIYLISSQGLTLAASNWQSSDSFIGVNYAFRPYFVQARDGQAANYFALGTQSRKRGYYFAYPVKINGDISGVVALKVSLSILEQDAAFESIRLLLVDDNGVIFYSTHNEWNFHSLAELGKPIMAEILRQRQFGDYQIEPLIAGQSLAEINRKTRIQLPLAGFNRQYLKDSLPMPKQNWKLIALTPAKLINTTIFVALLSVTIGYLLLMFIWLYWRSRVQAQQALTKINDELEARVDRRTAELSTANTKLRDSVEKYRQTEIELKQTQNELVQAAKLATLGEMSAGINHELNQPLAALRTYTENSVRLLDKSQTQSVRDNLKEMLGLTDMMASIISQLKAFSRKPKGQAAPIRLVDVVQASIVILQNKLKSHKVKIEVLNLTDDIYVYAESIQLEQVLINLLNNALQATSAVELPQILLQVSSNTDMVRILLEDNGVGLYEDQLAHLFEPFYTTKQQGLGLGLALSKRIIESFGGTIFAARSPLGGASFCVELRIANNT